MIAGDVWRLNLSEGLARLSAGTLTAVDWVESLLARIGECEESVKAWAALDRGAALSAAGEADAKRASGKSGPLCGAPYGVKDIIDVKGLPREAGSPLFKGYFPEEDASCIARLRAAGAIVLGKTVTTQFATSDIPEGTRNPWNLARTPGGSSSGSAAAVATGMVPAALGTQTGGSILRPAAYCGVVGFKPTYGRISRGGVIPVSWTLDHVGTLTRTVEDAARLLTAMAGSDERDQGTSLEPAPDYTAVSAPRRPERICFLRENVRSRAEPGVAEFVEGAVSRMQKKGVAVKEERIPVNLDVLHAAHRTILRVEVASYHEEMFREHPDAYNPGIRSNVSAGLMVPAAHYIKALRLRARLAREMYKFFDRYALVVLPAYVEPPPEAEVSTGNALFNEPLTQAGLPSLTLPIGRGEGNLPIGIQFGAARFAEADLLAHARWCEAELGWCAEIAEPERA